MFGEFAEKYFSSANHSVFEYLFIASLNLKYLCTEYY